MGYIHIDNLYKDKRILLFKECFALLKIHGTSAHVKYNDSQLHFFSGGVPHENFVELFDQDALLTKFIEMGHTNITIWGEAYGGKCQGMSKTYGDKLKFISFEVSINDQFLNVETAHNIVDRLGLKFVPYERTSTDIAHLDVIRLKPDPIAIEEGISYYENGILVNPRIREGIVLRPVTEFYDHHGRVIAKYKNDDFCETKTKRVVSNDELQVLEEAENIATEWVTPMRLEHILQKIPEHSLEIIPIIIKAMYDDIIREGQGEFIESKNLRKVVGKHTVSLYKTKLRELLC